MFKTIVIFTTLYFEVTNCCYGFVGIIENVGHRTSLTKEFSFDILNLYIVLLCYVMLSAIIVSNKTKTNPRVSHL